MTRASSPTLEATDAKGSRYQAVFRILAVIEDEPGATILDRLAAIPPETYAAASGLSDLASPSEGYTCEGHRLVSSVLMSSSAAGNGGRVQTLAALRQRLLSQYAGHLEQRRRLSKARSVDRRETEKVRSDRLAGALSVIPVSSRPTHSFYNGEDLIVRAAILYKDRVWSKPAPYRHSDTVNEMFGVLGGVIDAPQIDGFLTASGNFVERAEAKRIAKVLRQTFLRETHQTELFSEDLW